MKTKGGPRRVFECPLPECPFIAMSTMALKVLFNIIVQRQIQRLMVRSLAHKVFFVLITVDMNMTMSTSKNLNIK